MRLHISSRITDHAAPNDLLGTDFLYSRGLFEFAELEQSERCIPLYFSLQENHQVVAFARTCTHVTKIPFTFDLPEFLALQGTWSNLLPGSSILYVYSPYRPRSDIMAKSRRSREAILEAILDYAVQSKLRAVAFPSVLESNVELGSLLTQKGFVSSFHEGDFYLDVGSGTYGDFLARLPRGARQQFRHDERYPLREGLEVSEVDDIGAVADRLAELHAMLMTKYGHTSVELTSRSFTRFRDLIPNSLCIVAIKDSVIVAFVVSAHDRRTFHCLRCGQDYNCFSEQGQYFHLCFYQSVKKAIELGCRRVDLGRAGYRAKMLRGCSVERSQAHIKFMDPSEHEFWSAWITAISSSREAAFLRRTRRDALLGGNESLGG